MSKIGVFICHCGENIGATIDCEKVAAEAAKFDGVAFATDYKYMCSDPGQSLIRKAIEEQKLDGVVVAACSPRMHEPTFRRAWPTCASIARGCTKKENPRLRKRSTSFAGWSRK